jgi:hypothetical protein
VAVRTVVVQGLWTFVVDGRADQVLRPADVGASDAAANSAASDVRPAAAASDAINSAALVANAAVVDANSASIAATDADAPKAAVNSAGLGNFGCFQGTVGDACHDGLWAVSRHPAERCRNARSPEVLSRLCF